MTTPVVVVLLSTRRRVADESSSWKSRCPAPRIRGWISSVYSSTSLLRIKDLTSSPLPSITRSLPSCFLSLATVTAASPLRRVEFIHGSGCSSVLETTNFGELLRTSVKRLSARLGQTLYKSPYGRLPNSSPPVVAMLSPAARPMSESAYGPAQPPCLKPPRRSSSGRPGACITTSCVRL